MHVWETNVAIHTLGVSYSHFSGKIPVWGRTYLCTEPADQELHVQGEATISEFLLGLQEASSKGSGCLAFE